MSARKQLNIRSEEAHQLAASLARRMGTSTTKVVETALRQLDRSVPADTAPLTPEQQVEHDRFMAFLRSVRHTVPADATSDHDGLYDEHGLPR